ICAVVCGSLKPTGFILFRIRRSHRCPFCGCRLHHHRELRDRFQGPPHCVPQYLIETGHPGPFPPDLSSSGVFLPTQSREIVATNGITFGPNSVRTSDISSNGPLSPRMDQIPEKIWSLHPTMVLRGDGSM